MEEKEKNRSFFGKLIKRVKKTKSQESDNVSSSSSIILPESSLKSNNTINTEPELPNLPADRGFYISNGYIQNNSPSLKSYFGRVDKYQVKDRTILSHEFVAVKSIDDEVAGDINEIRLLGQCKHRNIVHCFGCFEENQKILIVAELMDGDLHSFLLNPKNDLTFCNAFGMILQICKGMQYLISRTIIHRDLAARNCLMCIDKKVIKITDFGLGRKLYNKMYYRQSAKTIFPPKWTALECLVGGPFTEKSDVWSFGVLIWEVLSRQKDPYSKIKEFHELVDFLSKGHRLEIPCENLMKDLYDLMCLCWNENAENRPTFTQLYEKLSKIKKSEDFPSKEKVKMPKSEQIEFNSLMQILGNANSDDNTDFSNDDSYSESDDECSLKLDEVELTELGIRKIDKEHLELVKKIDEGAYGDVFKYKVKNQTTIPHEFVAIKNIDKRVKELKIQGQCKHKNIVELLGYFVEHENIFIVMKFLLAGNLCSYLHDSKNQYNIGQAFDIVLQIIDGMEYLHSKDIVFRGLTPLNCMFSAGKKVIKLNGFAMCRKLNSNGVYTNKYDAVIVMGTALESLITGQYTKMSDVWSFGVLMWEIFARQIPYYNVNSIEELKVAIKNGQRLKRPIESCSPKTYGLMLKCWEKDPMKRPNFGEIRETLEEIMENMENGEDEELDDKKDIVTESQSLDSKYYMLKQVELVKET